MGLERHFSLAGRGVVVTGGGGHLGRAMALALADAGARVVVMGRSEDPLRRVIAELEARAEPGSGFEPCARAVAGDISRPEDIERVIAAVAELGVPLRGWVNNAYYGAAAQLGALEREAVLRSLDGGLTDAMLLTDQVADAMAAHGLGGAIVNVSSMYGMVSPQPSLYAEHERFHNPPAYGAAKAALLQFTRYAATHLATRGVRVNALSPGAFPSEPVQQHAGFVRALEQRVPLGRIGQPHELGGAVIFLLSDASSYMTGHNLVIDGGWTIW